MSKELPAQAPLGPKTYGRVGADLPERPLKLKIVYLTTDEDFICPDDVTGAEIEMAADGGGGGSGVSTTIGASGGQGGQWLKGWVDLEPGETYAYNKGSKGIGAASGSSSNLNGTDATESTFTGPGVNIRLLGGRGGKGDGSTTAVRGITVVSQKHYSVYATSLGGIANSNADGSPGGNADDQMGGDGGLQPGGGGGGATGYGRGAAGGNNDLPGNAVPDANSGAGGAGSGATTSGLTKGGTDGSEGFLRLRMWTRWV